MIWLVGIYALVALICAVRIGREVFLNGWLALAIVLWPLTAVLALILRQVLPERVPEDLDF